MELYLATLCERGEVDGEHLTVAGSGRAVRFQPTFPFHLDCALAIVVAVDALDGPGPHAVRVQLTNVEERVLGEVRTTITSRALAVEEVAHVATVVSLEPLEVPTPGRYVLRLWLDDRELRRVAVRAIRARSPSSAPVGRSTAAPPRRDRARRPVDA